MQNIKRTIDNSVLFVIEKLSEVMNPLVLKFINERNKLLIFYFHGLYENETQRQSNHVDPQNNLTVPQFVEFIEYYLHHKYDFIRPEDLLSDLPNDKAYIMLTFDDGYFNNTLAIEVLNKYKIPATFFITTKNMVNQTSFWWDIIFKYRIRKGVPLKKIREEQSYLKDFKYNYIDSYIAEHFGSASIKPWSDIDRPLTTEELGIISQNPLISIGNHTHNHAILTNYDSTEIREEFRKSTKILSEVLGFKPKFIAFPNGNYNTDVVEICKQEEFLITFNTVGRKNQMDILSNNINLNNNSILNLNRFMAQTINIKKYGEYDRLGYTPHSFYLNVKHSMNVFK